jgi:hypothetical protein
MLGGIMLFVDRQEELARLDRLAARSEGGLAVVYGRRRVGKTRLLLEWAERTGGLYTVADQSLPDLQRRYLAEAIATRLPGFADVEYRDWRSLFARLAREARSAGWRGPLILDELPYLAQTSPELPSVLQQFVDHEARVAKLRLVIAGSSQRMMHGFVLSAAAPLFGRAQEILKLEPLQPGHLRRVFPAQRGIAWAELYTAWGGIPRYWELAHEIGGTARSQIEHLVLDPLGSLHREPDYLLLEEVPPAREVRPLLDAIGAGAHRASEIAGRLGKPATSMSRPLERLLELGLVRREVPFGENERNSKRTLYKIHDPFFRLWFRVVAPHRAQLASGNRQARSQILMRFWQGLCAEGWEDLCRSLLPDLDKRNGRAKASNWGSSQRWWHGDAPEWDVVSTDRSEGRLLLGEAKWSAKPLSAKALSKMIADLAAKPAPKLAGHFATLAVERMLMVPEVVPEARRVAAAAQVRVVTAAELL